MISSDLRESQGEGLTVPRQLSEKEREDIVQRVVGGWENILDDAGDVFDRPAFVAGNDERSPLGTAVRELSRLNCRLWARADKSGYSPTVNAGNAEICSPYLDSLGESPSGESLAPPFTGGQCAGKRYILNFSIQPFNGSVANGSPGGRRGPIGRRIENPFAGRWEVWQDFFTSGGSPTTALLAGFNSQGGPPTIVTWNLTSQDGPDNCGNPPTEYQAPGQITGGTPPSPNLTVNLPGIGDIGLTVSLDPDGKPIVCIPVLDICATVDLPFLAPPADPSEPTPSPGPGDIGEAGSPVDTGAGSSAEGEAPAGSVLTAIKVNILSSPASPRTFAPGVFRAVCYAYLGTADGLDLDPAGASLSDGQLILAEKDNLTKFRVNANVGFNLRITPFFREVEP